MYFSCFIFLLHTFPHTPYSLPHTPITLTPGTGPFYYVSICSLHFSFYLFLSACIFSSSLLLLLAQFVGFNRIRNIYTMHAHNHIQTHILTIFASICLFTCTNEYTHTESDTDTDKDTGLTTTCTEVYPAYSILM